MIAIATTAILLSTRPRAWQAMHSAHKTTATRAESGCDSWRFATFARSFAALTHSLHRRVLAGLVEVLSYAGVGITKLGYGGAIEAQPVRQFRNSQ